MYSTTSKKKAKKHRHIEDQLCGLMSETEFDQLALQSKGCIDLH